MIRPPQCVCPYPKTSRGSTIASVILDLGFISPPNGDDTLMHIRAGWLAPDFIQLWLHSHTKKQSNEFKKALGNDTILYVHHMGKKGIES